MVNNIHSTGDIRNYDNDLRTKTPILNKPLIYKWRRQWRVLDKTIPIQIISKCRTQAWKEYLEVLENHKNNTLTL